LVAVYVAASLSFIPGLLLSIGAGFLFGIPLGIVTVSIGSTLGATAAFLVGRTWGRRPIQTMIAGNPKFAAIDAAVACEGFKIVLLSRLSPVLPYNLLNYALGLTPVALGEFVLATWIGMLPITFLYVYLGSTLSDLAEVEVSLTHSPVGQPLFLSLGLAATIVLMVVLMRISRKALREAIGELPSP
jgi:uncharacterized membrane protein YdjX (TVP38/TMEM64 family)